MLVNIFNEGEIPWIRKTGPIYGLEITPGLYGLLRADPRIRMSVTTKEEAKKLATEAFEKIKAEEKKKKEENVTKFVVTDSVEIKKAEPKDMDDEEIDAILENESTTETSAFEEASTSEEVKTVKKYTKEELEKMTKAQMKEILKERGYTSGPYAGKYHDTVADLIEKVLKTQA